MWSRKRYCWHYVGNSDCQLKCRAASVMGGIKSSLFQCGTLHLRIVFQFLIRNERHCLRIWAGQGYHLPLTSVTSTTTATSMPVTSATTSAYVTAATGLAGTARRAILAVVCGQGCAVCHLDRLLSAQSVCPPWLQAPPPMKLTIPAA